jgi:cobalamin biosynthesis Mg chelatase CobN
VLVLVALACFPALAHAEIPEYETEVPTTTGHKHPPAHPNNPVGGNQSHSGSNGGATASNAPGDSGGSGSSSRKSSSGGAIAEASNHPGTGNGGSAGQGSQGNGATAGQSSGGSQQGQPVNNASKSDDGGSSPLVPILIAVAALAAISIGAVVIRQRRQRTGSPISPKAS